jgi:hypothetical protein
MAGRIRPLKKLRKTGKITNHTLNRQVGSLRDHKPLTTMLNVGTIAEIHDARSFAGHAEEEKHFIPGSHIGSAPICEQVIASVSP